MSHRKGFITRQAKRLNNGEINRRRFVMTALSAGVTLPTAMSLASKAEARGPVPGGTLRIALTEATPIPSDPLEATTRGARLLAFARGNALTEITPEDAVIGELAEVLTPSEDHRVWHVRLRDEVHFHTGAPLTAADVSATLMRAAAVLPGLQNVEVINDATLTLDLDAPDPDLPRRLADPRLTILENGDPNGSTTGAYDVADQGLTDPLRLIRRDTYWKPGRAHLETVELHSLPDVATRQRAILAGDVDYAEGIDPRALALLQQTPGITLLESDAERRMVLAPGPDVSDAELMDHVAAMIAPETFVEHLLLGHGAPGSHLTPNSPAALPAALRLGYADDGVPRGRDVADMIAARLRSNGVRVDLTTDPATAPDLWLAWQQGDAADDTGLTLFWANELSAYRQPLTPPTTVSQSSAHDGARLIERWWLSQNGNNAASS
ncbi:MAG: ABC transporter substrate-binding protein [Paracoccaceae bacterium]